MCACGHACVVIHPSLHGVCVQVETDYGSGTGGYHGDDPLGLALYILNVGNVCKGLRVSIPHVIGCLQHLFLAVFVLELVLRVYFFSWRAFLDGWTSFDLLLVLASAIDLWVGAGPQDCLSSIHHSTRTHIYTYTHEGRRCVWCVQVIQVIAYGGAEEPASMQAVTVFRIVRLCKLARLIRILRAFKELWYVTRHADCVNKHRGVRCTSHPLVGWV